MKTPQKNHPAIRAPWLWRALAITPLCLPAAWAQTPDTQVFTLGTVEVRGTRASEAGDADVQRIGSEAMEVGNANTVADAVQTLPGVSQTSNSRNEAMVQLRGFDLRQVPVYVDGIPLYVPYDGYVDLGRFTTFDLSEINVSKSGASLLYGPNTLGGAINLVTRKPAKAFEGDVRLGFGSGSEYKAAANLGGNQGAWYYQIGLSYLKADSFPLPKNFIDFKQQPSDLGDERENAHRTDKRLSFKVGITPNATDEYAIGYVRQEGEKGNPVYTGASTARNAVRYWRWPYWDKDSIYVLTRTRIGADNVLKTRLYHDNYKNGLDMYQDGSYTLHDPTSSYKDVSKGASVEWANYSVKGHELSLAAHYKVDEHAEAPAYYRDVTTSVALEDRITLGERWQLTLGLGHDRREAKDVYVWPTGSADGNSGLAKLSYALGAEGDELYAVLSHKMRFPTIKDRYSARMGRALPNPDLRPESANHLELGVSAAAWRGARAHVALFHSRVKDQIQTVVVPSGACGGTTCDQAQNVGKTRNQGVELSLSQQLSAQWALEAGYTYLDRTNLSDRRVTLVDTPEHRLAAAVRWSPTAQWQLRAEVEAEKGRQAPFSGRTEPIGLGGYAIVNLRARYEFRPGMTLDLGIANVGDKWYELADGYPMPGRAYYATLGYRF